MTVSKYDYFQEMTISKVNLSMGRTSESCWGDSMEDGLSSLLMNEERGPDFN